MIDRLKTNPGFHKHFEMHRFQSEERIILNKLAKEWYLTNSGERISIATSSYDFFLMKPTNLFSEMFNIEREIICIFSNYPNFEPRTLDAFDIAQKKLGSSLRTENICRVLVSKDLNTERLIESFIKTDPEQPIVVPFTHGELLSKHDEFFIRNKFVKHFYSRDLFSFFSPLKKEIYFFGRSELVQNLLNRHRSGEHTGLFGIRKSGKTSIIYALERVLDSQNEFYVSIDCESPSVHALRWYELLHKIIIMFRDKTKIEIDIDEKNYNEKKAADNFERDFMLIFAKAKLGKPILLVFDEIERISPTTASSGHWRKDDDFVFFWQSLRGFYQRNQNKITYLLVGTNPSGVEQPIINGHENPLFGSIPSQYVPPFTVEQVRQMVRKLGRYMGVKFDEKIYTMLADDFGGHPYLIRKMCSNLIMLSSKDRPIVIDKSTYERGKKEFLANSSEFLEMIIQVLKEWYNDEYDMLCFLANGDIDTFNGCALDNPNNTKHLIGYGLLQKGKSGYVFNIESLKEYLNNKHKFEKLSLTNEEMLIEISMRRNRIEKATRLLIKSTLKIYYGKDAIDKVMGALPENRRVNGAGIDILLHKDNSPLFFLDLINIISREWEVFKNLVGMEKDKTMYMLREINEVGRPDAHAKRIEKDTFTQLRIFFNKLEKILKEWM